MDTKYPLKYPYKVIPHSISSTHRKTEVSPSWWHIAHFLFSSPDDSFSSFSFSVELRAHGWTWVCWIRNNLFGGRSHRLFFFFFLVHVYSLFAFEGGRFNDLIFHYWARYNPSCGTFPLPVKKLEGYWVVTTGFSVETIETT